MPIYQESLQICKKIYGPQHPEVADSLNNIALLLKNEGKYEEAMSLYQESLQIYKKMYGSEHPYYALSLYNIGGLVYEQGKYEESLKYFQDCYDIRCRISGANHPDTISTKAWIEKIESRKDKEVSFICKLLCCCHYYCHIVKL